MPYEYLGWFKNSNVTLVADLITDLNISDIVGRSSAKPNHSVLSWEFQLSTYKTMDKSANCECRGFMVIDRTHYMFHIAFLKLN